MTRTPKRKPTAAQRQRRASVWMRWLGILGAVPVDVTAFYVSYGHMRDLIIAHGESGLTPYILPLAVDGMMLTSAVAILANRGTRIPYVSFVVGLVLSLAANVATALGENVTSLIIAGVPTVLLVFTSEILLRLIVPARRKRRTTRTAQRATVRRLAVVRPAAVPALPALVPAAATA
jgi:hypothetical protein